MKNFLTVFLSIFFLTNSVKAQVINDSVFVCDVKYENPKFNNPHAGSAFVLKYKNKLYACTAKHVLFFAKTDSMKTISLDKTLLTWELKSKINSEIKILAGRLVNENKTEKLEMPPFGDWLIFEIKSEIPPNTVVYTLRENHLIDGEEISFLGYPYDADKPVHINGTFVGYNQDKNLKMDIAKGNYYGCSGGPVLDKNGLVVGIVSMGYFDEKNNKMVFEPASPDYFKQVIK
jgi:hypothetical protein